MEYSQTRSLNLGVAIDTSVEAAMIYDDLVYAQKVFGKGYFFRSYDQMMKRFPMWSESTIRRHVAKLVEAGYITTKVKKVNDKPTCHFQIERFLSVKMTETKETVKMTDSINIETTKKLKTDSSFLEDDNSASDGRTGAPALPLLEQVIAIVNPKEKATTERLRMLNGRLKDYTADEILGSARALSKSDWHRENKQMSVDNLLAPSKFGRWYAQRTDNVETQPEVTIENQDEMVRKRMGGDDGAQ